MVQSSKLSDNVELMTRVASLYYLEDITQGEIADRLGLSRPKVGRLLKRARQDGIVEIQVHTHPALSVPLENRLRERFNLQQVLLVSDQGNPSTQRAQVARMVGGFLLRNLQDGMVVAVGLGRNTGAIPDEISNVGPARHCTFISAIGGSPQVGTPINPNDICRRLAEAFGGEVESLYAPAYTESAEMRDMLLGHDQIRQTLDHARRADIALVGIGDAHDESAVVQMGCFSADEMRDMRGAGAVGDILGFFFDIKGRSVSEGMQNRVVGLTPEDMRDIPCVLGIASESSKASAILGALRSGLIDVLATSVGNARLILEYDED